MEKEERPEWVTYLPKQLHRLFDKAQAGLSTGQCWTDEEVALIMGTLKHSEPAKWKMYVAEFRLQLLDMLPIRSDCSEEIQSVIFKTASYRSMLEGNCVLKGQAVTADSLLYAIEPLVNSKRWSSKLVDAAVQALRGVTVVDFRNSTQHAVETYQCFIDKWVSYLDKHPYLMKELDPVYVVADVGGGQIPAWPNIPPNAPIGQLIPLSNSGYAWTFANNSAASFWCGAVRDALPNIRLWMFTTTVPSVYW